MASKENCFFQKMYIYFNNIEELFKGKEMLSMSQILLKKKVIMKPSDIDQISKPIGYLLTTMVFMQTGIILL